MVARSIPYFTILWEMKHFSSKPGLRGPIPVNFLKKKYFATNCQVPEYHSPIIASIENAGRYVLATMAVHKYLRVTDNAVCLVVNTSVGFVDKQALSGEIRLGEWHQIVDDFDVMSSKVHTKCSWVTLFKPCYC